jgi:hypothetical protein
VNLASVAFIPPSNPKLGQRSGGILLARDTRFNNNRYDVTFSPYENFAGNDPTQILPNRSSFTRCTFETQEAISNWFLAASRRSFAASRGAKPAHSWTLCKG